MVKLGGTTRVTLVPNIRDEGFLFCRDKIPLVKLNINSTLY